MEVNINYTPNINDYVQWNNGKGVEGWVYFKDEQYITIESLVRPKHKDDLKASPIHANNRLLVLCFSYQWKELTFVKSRKSIYEE